MKNQNPVASPNTQGVAFFTSQKFPACLAFAALLLLALTPLARAADAVGDYKSVITPGNWSANGTWNVCTVAGSPGTFVAASHAATSTDGVITIVSPHVVTITAVNSTIADQVVVNAGGTITVANSGGLTLNDGAGTDLDIFGTFNQGTAAGIKFTTGSPTVVVENGGLISGTTRNVVLNSSTGSPTITVNSGGTLALASSGCVVSSVGTPGITVAGSLMLTATKTQFSISGGVTAVTVANGGIIHDQSTGNAWIGSPANLTVEVQNGGTFATEISAAAALPFTTWDNGSSMLCSNGGNFLSGLSFTNSFYNFVVDAPSLSASLDGQVATGNNTIIRNALIVQNGNAQVFKIGGLGATLNVNDIAITNVTLNFQGSAGTAVTVNLTNNLFMAPNTALNISAAPTTPAAVNFVGGNTHTFTINAGTAGGGVGTATRWGWTVASADTLILAGKTSLSNNTPSTFSNNGTLITTSNTIIGSGTFTAGANSVTKLAGATGIENNNVAASISVATVTSDPAASYEFNGASAQTSGANFPTSVKNLVINNTAGVTLSAGITVNGKLSGSGKISAGTITASASGGVAPGNSPGTLTVSSLTLNAGSTNTFEVTNSATTGSGVNDELVIGTGGVLTPNGASITISNYGPTAIDNGVDITLIDYSAGSISGAFNSTPQWSSSISNFPGTTATIVDDAAGHIKLHVIVQAAPPAGIFFTNQPSTTVAGQSITPAVQVAATNADGSAYTNQAAITISKIAGNGTLSGTLTVATDPISGIASFANLSINLIGTDKQLQAANVAGGLTTSSSVFTISPAADAKLALGAQPTAGNAGVAFSPTPVVNILDSFGNQTTSSASVTVAQNTGGTLGGTLSVNAVNGVASFSGIFATNVGTIKLNYTSGSLTATNSGNIVMTAGTDAALAITTSIGAQQVDGTQFTPTPTVAILDAYSNLTASTATVTPHLASVTGGSLAGANTSGVSAASGTATFSALKFTLANPATLESGVVVYYTSGSLTTTTNASFTVNPAIQVTFTNQPTGTNAGSVIESAAVAPISVLVSNTSTASVVSGATVIMTVGTGTGTLHGTTSQISDVNGIATFNDLVLNVAGSKTLRAVTLGTTANSSSFYISPNAATAVQVLAPGETSAPDTTSPFKSGTPIGENRTIAFNVTVNDIDGFGNVDTNQAETITVTTSDANDTEPAPAALVAGTKSFTITPATAGSDVITATGAFTANTTVTINAAPYYRSRADGSWTTAATWEISTNGGTSYVTSSSTTPTAANSDAIEITNARTVTLGSSVSVDDMVIDAGGTLQVQGAGTLSISHDTASLVDCDVFGTMQSTASGSTIITNNGAAVLKFESGGQFAWTSTASPVIPQATWADGSLAQITAGITTAGTLLGSCQNFYDLSYVPASQGNVRLAMNFTNALTQIRHNFTVTVPSAGTASVSLANAAGAVVTVGNNATFTTGTASASNKILTDAAATDTLTLKVGGALTAVGTFDGFGGGATSLYEFTGASSSINIPTGTSGIGLNGNGGTFSYQVDGGATLTLGSAIAASATFNVNSNGTLICGANVISGTAFTNNAGGTLSIGSVAGITASGATGNIQSTSRSYSTNASYVYNGGVSQLVGNGLPSTVLNLTLAGGMTNTFTVANITGAAPAQTVAGTLTADTNVVAYNVSGASLTRGSYAVFHYGTLVGTFNSSPFLASGTTVGSPVTVTTGSGAVSLVVPNSAPVAVLDSFPRGSGISMKIATSSLTGNDTDVDGDTISFDGASATTTNGASITVSGGFVFVPANSVNDAFTYTIDDSHGGTNTGTVLLVLTSTSGQGVSVSPNTNSTLNVSFFGVPGFTYVVERATNISTPVWVDISTNTAPTNGAFNITDDFSIGLGGLQPDAAFYRLLVP